jgi:hypothetical protein
MTTFINEARKSFHSTLLETILITDKNGIPSNADKHSRPSVEIAKGIISQLGQNSAGARLAGQMAGSRFETIVCDFLTLTFPKLQHLRPGDWNLAKVGGRSRLEIANFDQYAHLVALDEATRGNPQLAAIIGSDYTITPDIIISRNRVEDVIINLTETLVDKEFARLTALRKINGNEPILHASVSCKWTIRSDRAQNARSEALNLIRNRKGKLPHIVVVTGEPVPARIASIAMGTGDLDCVYHFALPELVEATKLANFHDAEELLQTMIQGRRLKDIADLPLDLVQFQASNCARLTKRGMRYR